MTLTRRSRSSSREGGTAAKEGAENAAATELRAQEEDKIRDNLPREVIDLTRQMDLLQASSHATQATLSFLQREVSKISELLAGLAVTINRQSNTEATVTSEHASSTKGHPFTTPPPLTSHPLSTILEGSTPAISHTPPPLTQP